MNHKSILIKLLLAYIIIISQYSYADKQDDSTFPLVINSDYVEFNDQNGIATYTGNVTAAQGSRHLDSDTLVIHRNKDNKIEVVIASGKPARFKSQPDAMKPIGFGKANVIKYFPDENKALLIGDAELTQNQDVVKGEFLTYLFDTGLLKSKSTNNSRTTVILQP